MQNQASGDRWSCALTSGVIKGGTGGKPYEQRLLSARDGSTATSFQLLLLYITEYTSAEGDIEDVRRYTAGTFHSIGLDDVVMIAKPSSRYRCLHAALLSPANPRLRPPDSENSRSHSRRISEPR